MIERKPVQIISPLRAANGRSEQDHILFADKLCHLAATIGGVAPFAPHTFYTRFLDDRREDERRIGMDCGAVWLTLAAEVWVWDVWGISAGMAREIAFIEDLNARTTAADPRQLDLPFTEPLTAGRIALRPPGAQPFIVIRYARDVPAWKELIHE